MANKGAVIIGTILGMGALGLVLKRASALTTEPEAPKTTVDKTVAKARTKVNPTVQKGKDAVNRTASELQSLADQLKKLGK